MSSPSETKSRRRGVRSPVGRLSAAVGALALVAGVAATASASDSPPAAAAGKTVVDDAGGHGRYSAVIRRTEYGIPHIEAHDYGSLGYGYGYAFAQDNLCVLADRVLTLHGDRSRYFGPTAFSGDPLNGTDNLSSDAYYRGVRQSGVVQRLLAEPAPLGPTKEVRELVDGYVDGYNRYLAATGVANLPDPTCRGQAWVRPITAQDMWSNVLDLDEFGGVASFKQQIASAVPPASAAAAEAASAAPDTVPTGPITDDDKLGSNGWALGRDATTNHDGMLLGNPHFPWNSFGRFYQVQLTIPGTMDVSGASLDGSPTVEIGHTRGVAWTHTVSTAHRFTLYQLALVPGDPTSYLVDGKPEAMTRRTVEVPVLGTDGKVTDVTKTLYNSRYGPVLAANWQKGVTALAIHDANADNLRSMNEWLAMDRSQNLTELRQAQDKYQGIPFVNTIATDTSGTASYADAGVVPNVTDEEAARCIDTPLGTSAYPRTFILDGSTSACAWGSDPDAIEPGIFGPSRAPREEREDYVANSNNSPWLTNASAPITGYPRIFGDIATPRSLRTRLGLTMIGQRLAGTDGLGAPGFTLHTLQTVELGDRVLSAELGRDATVAMCRAHPTLTATDGKQIDVRAACAALAAWDLRGDADSHGSVLWMLYVNQPPTTNWWSVPFDPSKPVDTPNGFVADSPQAERALADAVEFLASNNTPVTAAMGDIQRWNGIPLNGCLGSAGCFNVVEASPTSGTGTGRSALAFGSSFIMAVELTPAGPHARTILTYSESDNPLSPHYSDQTVLFSHKQWVTERFTEAEIHADPQLQTTILKG